MINADLQAADAQTVSNIFQIALDLPVEKLTEGDIPAAVRLIMGVDPDRVSVRVALARLAAIQGVLDEVDGLV